MPGMMRIRIYDENGQRVVLLSPAGRKVRVLEVDPQDIIPGAILELDGNSFSVLPSTEKTGWFSALEIAKLDSAWGCEPA